MAADEDAPKPVGAAPGRRRRRAPERGGLSTYAERHAQALVYALGRLSKRPLTTALIMAVIGIALSLPAGLHVLIRNVSAASYSWESAVKASLFLKDSVSASEGQALAERIAQHPGVAAARYISRRQALQEFRKLSGFGSALDLLDNNPLPAVISVRPDPGLSAARAQALVHNLAALPGVARAKMDQAWLRRLRAILAIAHRTAWILAVLLALAVVIVVGSTIRLDIENQREAIEIMKMLGATDRFIRRPFLYAGAWYGLFGSVLGWIIVAASLWALSAPVARLASLYQGGFELAGLSWRGILGLVAAGVVLGWLGSWWAVGRHLREIQPS